MELIRMTTRNEFERYREEWSNILAENENTNPFIEFDWVNEWWRYLGEHQQIEVYAVKTSEKRIAFMPFVCHKSIFGYKYTFMAYGQANYMGFIAKSKDLEKSLEFVIDEIIKHKKNVVFDLHGLLESEESAASLACYLRRKNIKHFSHRVITPFIDLKEIKLEEYMKERQRLHRLDRREKRLAENSEFKIKRSMQSEMGKMFHLHDKRWKKKRDTSGFTDEKAKLFYRKLAGITKGPMKTEVDSLYIDDILIAFNYGFNCRGRFLGYVLGYDDDFEAFGPGRILEKEKILLCKSGDGKVFDLSIGYEAYKFDWNTGVDYTRRVIFSSNAPLAKAHRNYLMVREKMIGRMKENYRLVLFVRNTIGKWQFNIKEMLERGGQGVGGLCKQFFKRTRSCIYRNEKHIIYKLDKKKAPASSITEPFVKLTINDALKNEDIAEKHIQEVCRKLYGGYSGYYPQGNLSFDDILWMNDRVMRIDSISYLEQFKKKSIFFENWTAQNLSEAFSLIKENTKANTVYVTVQGNSKEGIHLLEEMGFRPFKKVNRRTYFGMNRLQITESY